MTDNRTPASRSALMARIGGKNTTPELAVRRLLHGMGYRFRLHRKDLPGTPDIVFPGRRKAIFVHGCFWHAHGCSIGRTPKSRLDYWLPKLDANKRRDAAKRAELEVIGWHSFTVWQCETKKLDDLAEALAAFLDGKNPDRHAGAKLLA
ncbi:very short patch repair endonuclease [Acidocella sp. C78]|uniref:very short patch repair endonuclease n=1 Tax=Acidocella sp. C78 TaxID=1671486 RepID=UPI00191B9296|nr:very short patch repair endonuclease [Acidocella sp. C78]